MLLAVLVLAACGSDAESGGAAVTEPAPGQAAPGPNGAVCAPPAEAVALADLGDPSLDEVSGAAVSARHRGITWLIEDSGNPAVVVAVGTDGATVATARLEAANRDWEDLALAPGPDGSPHLFVAEIGDNQAVHPSVAVLRFPEPDPAAGDAVVVPERIQLAYPDGPRDAEALLVDPASGDLVLVTKSLDGVADVFVAPGLATAPAPSGTTTLEPVGTLTLGTLEAVTAGDVSPDGRTIVLRSPVSTFVWHDDAGAGVARTLLDAEPCPAPAVLDPFGEAAAVDPADGSILLLGEGAGATLHRVPSPVGTGGITGP